MLHDQDGALVTERTIAGRVTIANFFYTQCGDICPMTRGNLQRVAVAFATDDRVVLLSHTVSPVADSTAQLASYAEEHSIPARRWHLLGGADTTLGRLARDGYFLAEPSGRGWGVDTLAHTERVVLVDADGHLRGVYNGTLAPEMQNLVADVRTLLASGSR